MKLVLLGVTEEFAILSEVTVLSAILAVPIVSLAICAEVMAKNYLGIHCTVI